MKLFSLENIRNKKPTVFFFRVVYVNYFIIIEVIIMIII